MSILVLTSDTLIGTPATGNLEYNGQFYGTDSALSRAQMQRITQGTAVASTSGTSIMFTSIPSWAKRITLMFTGVSLSGAANPLIQLGAGSATTSGYLSSSTTFAASSLSTANSTTGFNFALSSASSLFGGSLVITLLTGNTWTASGIIGESGSTRTSITAGSIPLSGTLDRVIVTTTNGTDTFDAGSINILYEG
jgi:hypothetical protein